MGESWKLLIRIVDRWWQFHLFILPALETVPTCDLFLLGWEWFHSANQNSRHELSSFGAYSWCLVFEVKLEGNSLRSWTLNTHFCVRESRRFAVKPFDVFLGGASRSAEWGMRSCRGHGGTRRSATWGRGGDPSCRCAWRAKERQAASGRRRLTSRRVTVPTGHGISHLCLLSSSSGVVTPSALNAPSSALMRDMDWWQEPASTHPRHFASIQCCGCVGSWNQSVGCLPFPESPHPKSTLGSLILKRPFSALRAKVANFL